ncbi:hypothetical protein PL373_18985 [Tenacibaculum maritimum]|nr:hypothetical protein [Tenacibaculum maritimum]MDB0603174.1 hypothetical protein [Tenacibaculum maritimum]MDB0610437.1 hypothetical protein [Tenacibaculum maritimum]
MKQLIKNIQQRLQPIQELKYVDEDWGQLDYYSPNFPVQWPCVLIDITNANFSNIGQDKRVKPMQRQMGETIFSFTIANLKLTNTSSKAPLAQKDNAWSIWELIEKVHTELQGFNPDTNAGKLIRTGWNRIKRDDGVQEYTVTYSCSLNNV